MSVAPRESVALPLPPPLRNKVKRLASRRHQTPLEFISEVLREHIARAEARDTLWREVRAYGAKKAKELGARTDEELERIITEAVNEYRAGNRSPYARALGDRPGGRTLG